MVGKDTRRRDDQAWLIDDQRRVQLDRRTSLLIGASCGAGHYGMCGRADPRFLVRPSASPRAAPGCRGVLSIVAEAAAGPRTASRQAADAAMRAWKEARSETESLPLGTVRMRYDDGVIDPRDTRTIFRNNGTARHRQWPDRGTSNFGVFRM